MDGISADVFQVWIWYFGANTKDDTEASVILMCGKSWHPPDVFLSVDARHFKEHVENRYRGVPSLEEIQPDDCVAASRRLLDPRQASQKK